MFTDKKTITDPWTLHSAQLADDDFKPSGFSGGGWNTHSVQDDVLDSKSRSNLKGLTDQPASRPELNISPLSIWEIIEDTLQGTNQRDVIITGLSIPPEMLIKADTDRDGLVDIYIPYSIDLPPAFSQLGPLTIHTHIDNFDINKNQLIANDDPFRTSGIVVGHEIL